MWLASWHHPCRPRSGGVWYNTSSQQATRPQASAAAVCAAAAPCPKPWPRRQNRRGLPPVRPQSSWPAARHLRLRSHLRLLSRRRRPCDAAPQRRPPASATAAALCFSSQGALKVSGVVATNEHSGGDRSFRSWFQLPYIAHQQKRQHGTGYGMWASYHTSYSDSFVFRRPVSEYKAPTHRASATHIPHKITQKGNITAQHAQDPKTILS